MEKHWIHAEPRRIQYKDIMIITAAKGKLAEITSRLDALKIPSKVEGSVSFEGNEALSVVCDIYKAVSGSYDKISIYSALTGKIFGFSVEDMINFRNDKGILTLGSTLNKDCAKSEISSHISKVLLRELLHNCIAHSNYQLGGRIYLNEFEDKIIITNPGDFLPEKISTVLQSTYNPPFYRNQLLADAMVKFHMIDTATSGIKKVFRIQKEKYFPMPDYNFNNGNQTEVTVYGKILDEKFMYMLFNHPELDLETVFLLDQVQKGNGSCISKEDKASLKKLKLIEGRGNTVYLSSEVSKKLEQEAQYVKNKGFNDQYYKDLILKYLDEYQKAQKKDIKDLLWDKLPNVLDNQKKEYKVSTLLASLKKSELIVTDSENRQKSYWVLTEKGKNSLKI